MRGAPIQLLMPFRPRHALAAAALAPALLVPSVAQAGSGCAQASARPATISVAAADRATLCLLNVERRRHHLRPLRENRKLDHAASGHSRSMVNHHYFGHGDFAGRIRRAGYRGWTLGENIAWGSLQWSTPAAIVDMWMHSPGHRANILRPQFREIGIGIAVGAPQRGVGGAATYTTDFGKPA
jgi:uncharacterized protein YkwD